MVANFTSTEGWMNFVTLNKRWGQSYGVHTLAWRLTDTPADLWTARVNAFKEGQRPALRGAAAVYDDAVPRLLAHYRWKPAETAVMVALSSDATECIATKPLARLGKWLAGRIGASWEGPSLSKQAHKKLHTIKSFADRDAEVHEKYVCRKLGSVRNIILLDDIVTRGSTFAEVERAIQEQNRGVKTLPLAVGKAERKGYAASVGREISNEHVSAAWARLWDSAKDG